MVSFCMGGCAVSIHFSFFVIIAFCNLFAGFENAALVLCAVMMHELAHLFAMALTGNKPHKVVISALGMRIIVDKAPGYAKAAVMSLAGPLINLIVAAVCTLLDMEAMVYINLVLGIFHILPIEPLDGGLALRAFLCMRMRVEKAEKVSFVISLVVLVPMMVLGFLVLLHSKNNFTLLLAAVYLMLYLVLRNGNYML